MDELKTSFSDFSEFLNSLPYDGLVTGTVGGALGVLLFTFILLKLKRKKTAASENKNLQISPNKKSENEVDELKNIDQKVWLKKLRFGLSKSRYSIRESLSSLFNSNKIDEKVLEGLHETLYRSDIGAKTVDLLVERVRLHIKENKDIDWEKIRAVLEKETETILEEVSSQPNSNNIKDQAPKGPKVILVVGVNGVGKTTTIGKIAAHFLAEGKKVMLCAADTYRAAAIDQLKIWGNRLDIKVVAHKEGADPGAVAFDGVKAAKTRNVDVLLIDTAGRLHNKTDLMNELVKIKKVLGKDLAGAPHETFLVLDATTGQNAFQQVHAFKKIVAITGLCVTKLDGTAKGGALIGVANEFSIPIRYIGVGEKASDLRQFKAKEFAQSIFGS